MLRTVDDCHTLGADRHPALVHTGSDHLSHGQGALHRARSHRRCPQAPDDGLPGLLESFGPQESWIGQAKGKGDDA